MFSKTNLLLTILIIVIIFFANLEPTQQVQHMLVDGYGNVFAHGSASRGFGNFQFVTMFTPDGRRQWTKRYQQVFLSRDEQGVVGTASQDGMVRYELYGRNGKVAVAKQLRLPASEVIAGIRTDPNGGLSILAKRNLPKDSAASTADRVITYTLARFNAGGVRVFHQALGAIPLDQPLRVSLSAQLLDANDQVYILGYRLNHAASQLLLYQSAAGELTPRLIKTTKAWTANNLAFGPKEHLYFTGTATGTKPNPAKVFVGSFDPELGVQWIRRYGRDNIERVWDIQVTDDQNLWLIGESDVQDSRKLVCLSLSSAGAIRERRVLKTFDDQVGRVAAIAADSSLWLGENLGSAFRLTKFNRDNQPVFERSYRNHHWFQNMVVLLLVGLIVGSPFIRRREQIRVAMNDKRKKNIDENR